ncbi:MAG TPA: hypothetical protein ENJ82_05965 [Bacteroidetes bacterium]|nr:hypothetical protein [Bacteroidota bacterium]
MAFYSIGLFLDNTKYALKMRVEVVTNYTEANGNGGSLIPGWVLGNSQGEAMSFELSLVNANGVLIQNNIYLWYQEVSGRNYLYYSMTLNGAAVQTLDKLPVGSDLISIEWILSGDTIIVGTVDALIEEPQPLALV